MRKLQIFFIIVISIIAFILLIAVASTLQQAARLGSGGTVSIFAIEPSAQTVVLQKVASELHLKVRNHGEGPY